MAVAGTSLATAHHQHQHQYQHQHQRQHQTLMPRCRPGSKNARRFLKPSVLCAICAKRCTNSLPNCAINRHGSLGCLALGARSNNGVMKSALGSRPRATATMTRARKNLSKSRRCTLCARPNVTLCTYGPLPLPGRVMTPRDTHPSFDHLVGNSEQPWGKCEAEGLGGF